VRTDEVYIGQEIERVLPDVSEEKRDEVVELVLRLISEES
jgi:hypothetical protein